MVLNLIHNKERVMKSTIKFLGIALITAAIVLAACGDGGGGGGGGGGGQTFVITNTAEWDTALATIKNQSRGKYTLTIDGDIGVAGSTDYTFGNSSNLSVTLKGSGKLYLTSQDSIIYIGANQTLIIDSANLTLQGSNNNNEPVVAVSDGGTLELQNGTISGNSAGGVFVGDGTFVMKGGKISGNTTTDCGGGVCVNGTNATFTMSGGEIFGNTASGIYSYGGGVFVYDNGTFRIVTGTIYGSNASPTSLRNTATNSGAALYKESGTAQRGTFSGANGAWVSKANLTDTNNTINVLNGDNK
jgi:hypothetical protein